MNKRKRGVAILLLAFLLSVTLAIPRAEPVNAARPKLNKTKTTLIKGKKVKLKVTGATKKIKWSTNKKKVATVNSQGVVRARGKGTAKITAKVGKRRLICRVTVKAKKKVLTPTLSDERISLNVGKQKQLKIFDTKRVPKWWSTNDKVATVDANGIVRGISPGECRVYAELPGTYFMCFVSVLGKAGTTVTPTAIPTISGTTTPTPAPTEDPVSTQTPVPTRTPTPEPTVTVTLTPKPTLTVTPTARPTQTPLVTPTATPGPTITATPTVRPTTTSTPRPTTTSTPRPTTTSAPTPTTTSTPRPTTTNTPRPTTTSAPTPTTAPTSTPTSTPEPSVVPTDAPGPTVTPTPTDTPTVEPTPTGPPTAGPTPTGSPTPIPVENFQLDKDPLQIYEGGSEKLTYSIMPENASNKTVVFSSSDSGIASVGNDGTVEAKTPGECMITAACGGIKVTCVVNILKKEMILDKDVLSIREGTVSQLNYALRLPEIEKSDLLLLSSDDRTVIVKDNGRRIGVRLQSVCFKQ